jgi:hypothetical protein
MAVILTTISNTDQRCKAGNQNWHTAILLLGGSAACPPFSARLWVTPARVTVNQRRTVVFAPTLPRMSVFLDRALYRAVSDAIGAPALLEQPGAWHGKESLPMQDQANALAERLRSNDEPLFVILALLPESG